MDTITILRVLRDLCRLRIFVVGVFVFALLAGGVAEYKVPNFESRRYEVGVATARILVDTPSSQVVNVSPRGSDTTAARASLLASLMIDGVVKSTIAQQAGLQPNQLVGVTNAATDPSVGAAPVPVSAPSGPGAFVLTTQVLTNTSGDPLPIIELDTQAPNRAGAARLASAAIAGLSEYLASKAALERIPDADRLQVTGTGAPQATSEARGPSSMIAILVFVFVFLLGCAGILGVQALVRGWHAASAREQLGDDGLPGEEVLPPEASVPTPGERIPTPGERIMPTPRERVPTLGERVPRLEERFQLRRRSIVKSRNPGSANTEINDDQSASSYLDLLPQRLGPVGTQREHTLSAGSSVGSGSNAER